MTNYFSVTPQLKHFQFIVVGLEELPPDQTAALAERVCDCLYERGAMIDCITSLWIIASWEPSSTMIRPKRVWQPYPICSRRTPPRSESLMASA